MLILISLRLEEMLLMVGVARLTPRYDFVKPREGLVGHACFVWGEKGWQGRVLRGAMREIVKNLITGEDA